MRSRAGTQTREPAQPALLTKSTFHQFQKMQSLLANQHRWALQLTPPMAYMHPMAPFTWSILCWLSCKYLSDKRTFIFIQIVLC